MENDQTDNFFIWKFDGKELGILFGIIFMMYFGIFTVLINGDTLFIAQLIFVLDLIATITWLWGVAKKKPELMLSSLICWGIVLNITVGFIFTLLFNVPILSNRESMLILIIVVVTVPLVIFYFILMISQKSIKRFVQRKHSESRINWKIYAIAIGWIVISFSIGLALYYGERDEFIIAFTLFIINLVLTCCWFWGVSMKNIKFMLATLIWWAFGLFIIFYITYDGKIIDVSSLPNPNYEIIHVITGFFTILYFVAVWSFISIRNDVLRNSESNELDIVDTIDGDESNGVEKCKIIYSMLT